MQIVRLTLQHPNLFCPVTGVQILSEDYCNDDARSSMGYWLDDFLSKPTITNEKLQIAWDIFYFNYKKLNQKEPNKEAIESFLIQYPEPNWIIFKIKNTTMSGGSIFDTTYHIINMNAD